MPKFKVILDTDIGDDIDDAIALALLLNSDEVELLGVTTVFRNAFKRAEMAKYFITINGYDIPVYAGMDQPLKQDVSLIVPSEIKQREKIDEYGKYLIPQYLPEMKDAKVEPGNAVDFLIKKVHEYPHEVIILAVGPLTNIAMALTKDPSIIPLIREIRIMGGYPDCHYPEWNILCDPEAAAIVYQSNVNLYAVGLNVTLQCELDSTRMKALEKVSENGSKLLKTMLEKWFAHYRFKTPVMHDPLTAASILMPCVVFERAPYYVDLDVKRAHTIKSENGNEVFCATSVDTNMFFKLLFERVFK